MRVYRVEKPDGSGPHHNYHVDGYPADYRPGPMSDGLEGYRAKPYGKFGCLSLDDLRSWFRVPSENYKLLREGYHIAVYETSDLQIGVSRKQCAFRNGALVETLPIEELNYADKNLV